MNKFLIIPIFNEIEKSISVAEKYNLGFEFNDFFHPAILSDEKRLNDRIENYNALKLPDFLTSHGDFFDVTIFSEDPEIRRISDLRVRQSIETARKLGAKAVVFHGNHNPFLKGRAYLDHWLKLNEEYWSKILSENPDINIYIENMFDESPYLLAELSERLSSFSNYGICYDYAHAVISKTPVELWTETLAPYVRHLHINDNDLSEDSHLAVGEGKIDWVMFKKALKEKFPDASVLIETSTLERQEKSIEFLLKNGII